MLVTAAGNLHGKARQLTSQDVCEGHTVTHATNPEKCQIKISLTWHSHQTCTDMNLVISLVDSIGLILFSSL
jgi:hypothetical protein